MKKRALSLFLALVFCFSMLPATALAEGESGGVYLPSGSADGTGGVYELAEETAVAVVISDGQETGYDTLTKAFQAANASRGSTLKLKKDAAVNSTDGHGIEITGDFTLDLNGKTLRWGDSACTSSDKEGSLLYTTHYGHLIITDSSEQGSGKIEQNAGTTALSVLNSSTVEINGGTIETTSTIGDTDLSNKTNPPNSAVYVLNDGTAEIHGGTITGAKIGVAVCDGTLKITGGSIYGKNSNAVQAMDGKVELSGGTYTTDEPDNHSIWNRSGAAADLLADGYRFEDESGSESAYSEGGNGVKGKTIVRKAPEETGVKYIDKDGKEQLCKTFTEITEAPDSLPEGWYAVKGTVNVTTHNLFADGTVNLILCDGAELNLSYGLHMSGISKLNIYGQSGGTGRLIAKGSGGQTAIGLSNNPGNHQAEIRICGGTIIAQAESGVQAIGRSESSTGYIVVTRSRNIKCVKTDEPNQPYSWENTDGTSVTISKCTDHVWGYQINGEYHFKRCDLCGAPASAEIEQLHTYTDWTPAENGTDHIGTCVCGATTTEAHTFEVQPNADGLTHSQTCSKCGYKGEAERHTYTEQDINGYKWQKCDCGALLAAEYNDVQYASLQAAVDAAAKDGGTVTLAQNVPESVTVSGGNVTIDLGAHEWGADRSTALEVTGGSVTLQNGTLGKLGYCALVLSGGTVQIGENMTLWGGKDYNTIYPAISVTNADAKLMLCEGTKLIYGMEVPESRKLSDYLPDGMAFVKCGVDGTITNEVVSAVYMSSKYAEDMAVAKNEHSEGSRQAIKSENELRTATAGYYFLAEDITLIDSAWYPQKGTVLDLNGHSITANGNFYTIVVSGGSFTLLDSKNAGRITHSTEGSGCGVFVRSDSSFTM